MGIEEKRRRVGRKMDLRGQRRTGKKPSGYPREEVCPYGRKMDSREQPRTQVIPAARPKGMQACIARTVQNKVQAALDEGCMSKPLPIFSCEGSWWRIACALQPSLSRSQRPSPIFVCMISIVVQQFVSQYAVAFLGEMNVCLRLR